MKVIEAINQIDNIKPNNYSQTDKVKWLSRLDGQIKEAIIDTHECEEEITFTPYTEDDMNKEMLVPYPYDDLYIKWLESQIDYSNNEYAKYNNSSSAFNAAYDNFAKHYNRTHMPKGKKIKFI